MIIGIVGLGVVGSAIKYGFEKLGHTVLGHDLKLGTHLSELLTSEVIYICVPTPSNNTGACNTTIVESVVDELHALDYSGTIAIKSTVSPGTTQALINKYKNNKICFIPEFLRERAATTDFTENHDLCVIGTLEAQQFEVIRQSHGSYPKKIMQTSPTEAELVKYFNNIYNATLITFANSFYEVCKSLDVNYSNVKNAIVNREHITDIYLDCNDNFRGFAGVCLPKDLAAIRHLCEERGLDVSFFKNIEDENNRYSPTVFDGMRLC
jgi:UDPglucose 6-dehydrogenase